MDYYGVLSDVVELQYMGENRVILFKCDWWDVHSQDRGIDVDKYDIVSVNVKRPLMTNEPFVLACQAEQVFYVNDNARPDYQIVLKTEHRDLYKMSSNEDEKNVDDLEAIQQNFNGRLHTSTHLKDNINDASS